MRLWLGWLVLAGVVWAQSGNDRARATWERLAQAGKVPLSSHVASRLRVERLGNRIVAVTKRTQFPWHFYVLAKKEVNAFTVGEGYVAVSEGLLGLGLDDQELAGILAHEVAHGTEQHLLREVNNDLQLQQAQRELTEAQVLQQRYEQEYRSSGDQTAYESQMVTVRRRLGAAQKRLDYLQGQQRFAREFNHEQEMEADLVGIRYAVTAGFEADGLERALRRIQARGVEQFGEQYTGEGQTHPSISKRLELLARVYQSWKAQGWGTDKK